jgi:predicted amidohydrolase YtcJ
MFAAVALVVLNAHALTQDPARPAAAALAVVDGRLAYVGNDDAAARRAAGPGAQVLDVGGLTLVPGFNDAHVHFGLGLTLGGANGVDLPDCKRREFIERVKRASAAHPDGDFLFVKTRRLPSGVERARDLDFVDRPVFVVTSRGGLLNRRGLARSGFTADEAPNGFVRGRELAAALDRLVKNLPLGRLEAGARAFLAELARDGITSVQLIDELPDLFDGLRRSGELTARVRMVPLGYRFETRLYAPAWTSPAPEWVRVDGVKYFHDDGARLTRFELAELFDENVKAGRHVLVHVLSSHALDTLLDGLEPLARASQRPRATELFRIEHADEVTPEQAARLQRLGMIVCSNPSMIPEWQSAGAFPMRTLAAAGVRTCIGTDWVGAHEPARSLRPLDSIELAVTHGGYGEAERITVEQALEAYTVGSATAEDMASVKGSLAVGKLADFALLSSDPRRVAPDKLHDIEVLLTVVGGRVVYRSPAFERLTRHAPPAISAPPVRPPPSIGPRPSPKN